MKRYGVFALILPLFLATPSLSFAQSTTGATSSAASSTAPLVVPTAPVKSKTVESSVRQKIEDSRREKIVDYAEKASARLELVAEKQEDLILKIESRVRKYEERNYDVSLQEEKLALAYASLLEARAEVAAIMPYVEASLATKSAANALSTALESVRSAQDALAVSHQKISALISTLLELADSKPVSEQDAEDAQ